MKILASTALILLLLVTPAVHGDVEAHSLSTVLPESTATATGEPRSQPEGASVLDLSIFGIVSLGVLGLFWIRRHTSEL